jgi:hypothetical protein
MYSFSNGGPTVCKLDNSKQYSSLSSLGKIQCRWFVIIAGSAITSHSTRRGIVFCVRQTGKARSTPRNLTILVSSSTAFSL